MSGSFLLRECVFALRIHTEHLVQVRGKPGRISLQEYIWDLRRYYGNTTPT